MCKTIYVVRGFLGGRKQPEEQFSSEAHARLRAAYLGATYDSVAVGSRTINSEPYEDRKQTGQLSELRA
jgi:hypothetical protein